MRLGQNLMMQILKNHKWAIFLALATATIVAYPQIYLRYNLGDSYRGIEILGSIDDECAWLSRVREVQDGHPSLASVYFKEGKNDPYLFQPLGTMMVGFLGQVFSLDINNTILLSRLFFSFIVFLVIYSFLYLFTKKKIIALSVSSALLLANVLFESLFVRYLIISSNYLTLTRPVNPGLTWFFFFGFLLFFWLFLEKKQWRWGILSTLFLGLSFYDYFYTWTFLYVFCGVLGLIFLFQKRRQDFKNICLILLGAALIAIPYFINFYQVIIHPNYLEVGQRFGLVETRMPVFGRLATFLFVVFLLFFPRKEKKQFFFALALLITPFIVLNQQLITNKVMSVEVYHWYYHKTLAIIFLLIILFSRLSKKRWEFVQRALAVLIIMVSIGNGLFVQNHSYAVNEEGIIRNQRYGPLMSWLNQNTGKDEVAFSNNEIAYLIVIYTPLNVFYHSSAMYSLAATQDRLEKIQCLYYRLTGIGKDQVKDAFFENREDISHLLYGLVYQGEEGIPDGALLGLVQNCQESFSASTGDFFERMLQEYEVKYIIWDKTENPQWQLDQYLFLKRAAQFDDFVIYQKD